MKLILLAAFVAFAAATSPPVEEQTAAPVDQTADDGGFASQFAHQNPKFNFQKKPIVKKVIVKKFFVPAHKSFGFDEAAAANNEQTAETEQQTGVSEDAFKFVPHVPKVIKKIRFNPHHVKPVFNPHQPFHFDENAETETVQEPQPEEDEAADRENVNNLAAGKVLDIKNAKIPKAHKIDVRSKIGKIKMRFLHKGNKKALIKILRQPRVLAFWLAAHNFDGAKNRKFITAEEWDTMWRRLSKYWPEHLGTKIPVTLKNWRAVNSDKNGIVSVKDEIVPALMFEKDRFLFDALFSGLFYRIFDFNKDGHITNSVFKNFQGKRISEWDFFHNRAQWMNNILQLPTATAPELQKELDEITKTQGPEMAEELKKDLELVGAIESAEDKI